MSKVLLINPNIHIVDREKDHYSMMEHLGLGLLSAVLKNAGHEVTIIDCYALNKENNYAFNEAVIHKPDFIGITANYLNFDSAIDIGYQISVSLPNAYLFYGGEHCTYSSEEILERYSFVDAIVRGEGEQTTVELINNAPNLHGIPGTHFRDKNQKIIIQNPDRAGIDDLSELPFADRTTLDYCKKNNMTTAIGVLSQRGCNHQCKFCNAYNFFRMGGGLPIRRRSPRNVVDELEQLYQRYYINGNIEKVYFYDANFIDGSDKSKTWAIEFAREILARDIVMPFEIYLRGDSLKKGDDNILILLKKAGLEAVFIGIESFSENDLAFYGKNISVNRLIEGMDILEKHHVLGPTPGVIMFNPFSTDESLIQSANLLERYGYASFWNLSQRLQLFPGVKLVDELKEKQLLTGYDSTNKVYSYIFKDKCIEELSEYLLSLNQHPEIIRDNALPRHVTTELLRIVNTITQLELDNDNFEELLHPIEKQKNSINTLNVKYFSDTIHNFRKGVDMQTIENRTHQYLDDLSDRLNQIDLVFTDTLRSLDTYLSHQDK